MNTCETCKNWVPVASERFNFWDPAVYGRCDAADAWKEVDGNEVHVKSTFGCILHEPKEVGD